MDVDDYGDYDDYGNPAKDTHRHFPLWKGGCHQSGTEVWMVMIIDHDELMNIAEKESGQEKKLLVKGNVTR